MHPSQECMRLYTNVKHSSKFNQIAIEALTGAYFEIKDYATLYVHEFPSANKFQKLNTSCHLSFIMAHNILPYMDHNFRVIAFM